MLVVMGPIMEIPVIDLFAVAILPEYCLQVYMQPTQQLDA